jgi:hypothetical protein
VAEARRYWSVALGSGMRLALGDPEVERAYRAALVVLLGCTERHGERLIPIGNPFQYRDVWLRDGARSVAALAMAGQVRMARELAAGFLAYQWPQGPFLSQRGQPDGTGQALWALGQACLRPGPDPEVARYADAALAAWRWCESQRASGLILGLPFGGLMPFGDPRDNELARAQLVGTDAWSLAGYRATARLLQAAGRAVESEEVARARAAYEAVFESTLASSAARDIPPSWQLSGHDWGNLSVVYPCQALQPGHPRVLALAQRVWSGVPEPGLVRYGSGDTLHTYLSADLGTWAMLAGRRTEADQVLAALLRWRTASGGSPELFVSGRRDFGHNLPPHATAAAAIVTLIRNAMVFDDDDTLRLTLGARGDWWASGEVRRAPTRWGWLDLTFRSDGQEAEWNWSPVPVPTALTLPPGTSARGPLTDARLRILGPGVVLAPPGVGHARVPLLPGEQDTSKPSWMRAAPGIRGMVPTGATARPSPRPPPSRPWGSASAPVPRRVTRPPGSGRGSALPDSIMAWSPVQAWHQALELMQTGRFGSSLPLFQRALMDPRIDREAWDIHYAYANSLNGAAFEVAERLGVAGPRQALSARRIALVREAVAQLDRAERIAKEPRVLAMIRSRHGRLLELWGFPLDAYGWYRASLAADRTFPEAIAGLRRIAALLRGSADAPPELRKR